MAIQVVRARERQPSTEDQFIEAFTQASSRVGEALAGRKRREEEAKLMQQKQDQENRQLEQLTGLDFSGISDPNLRRDIVKQTLMQQGKQQLLGQKTDYINKIMGESSHSPASDMSEKLQGFSPANISDEDIARLASVDPNTARALMHAKDVALREDREERAFKERERLSSPEYQRSKQLSTSQATADTAYNKELQSAFKQHEIKRNTLEKLEKLNAKGVTGKPYEKLLEKAGLVNLTSEGRREFAADVKNLITDIRAILGGQFSQAEFMTVLNAYPSADFSKEANDAIIRNLKEFEGIRSQEFKIANQLKKDNGGKIPEDFQTKVNEGLEAYAQTKIPAIKQNTQRIMNEEYGIPSGHTLMFDKSGEPLSVPNDQLDYYESLGAIRP